MASYDASMNSAQVGAKGQGAAFGPVNMPAVMAQAPNMQMQPSGLPSGPGQPGSGGMAGPPGLVGQGAFPAGQVPPQLASLLMGMNPNNPTPNKVPGMAGGLGAQGSPSGAFASGFGPGQGFQNRGPVASNGPAAGNSGAFGRMGGPSIGTPNMAPAQGMK